MELILESEKLAERTSENVVFINVSLFTYSKFQQLIYLHLTDTLETTSFQNNIKIASITI